MKVYTGGSLAKQNFLLEIPANMLIGKIRLRLVKATTSFEPVKAISRILNAITFTETLVDNFKSVQEVMATKIPLSFFNDMSSMGEGAVVHSTDVVMSEGGVAGVYADLMFKIPLAYVGSLDLNSQKYLSIDLDFGDLDSLSAELVSVEAYARQGRALTNDLIQYKRLNVPQGVLTYQFVPDGPAYVVAGQEGGVSSANIDFVEIAYNTGVTSRADFYELLAKYYEDNEISARFISSGNEFEGAYESTILALESVGVKSIRIVRQNTEDPTTIICLAKYVSSATDNRIANGSVTKLVTGEYVPAANRGEMELITVLEPMKPYAVSETIKTAVEQVPTTTKVSADPIAAVYAQMR